jgi:hypothetical protein
MNKNSQKPEDNFSNLVDSYTYALKDNSDIIVNMLEELSKRELSDTDIKDLKKINRELNSIDKQLNKLGE